MGGFAEFPVRVLEVIGAFNPTGLPSPYVNAVLAGAKGDGVTDDAPAINAAIAGMGSGVLWFPPGVYLCNSPIVVQDLAVSLQGAGVCVKGPGGFLASPTILKAGPGLTGPIVAYRQSVVTVPIGYQYIRDLALQGNPLAGGSQHGLSIFCSTMQVQNVLSFNNGGHGLALAFCADGAFYNVNCQGNGLDGINFNLQNASPSASLNNNQFYSCISQGNARSGVRFDSGGRYNCFWGGDFSANGEYGIDFYLLTGIAAIAVWNRFRYYHDDSSNVLGPIHFGVNAQGNDIISGAPQFQAPVVDGGLRYNNKYSACTPLDEENYSLITAAATTQPVAFQYPQPDTNYWVLTAFAPTGVCATKVITVTNLLVTGFTINADVAPGATLYVPWKICRFA